MVQLGFVQRPYPNFALLLMRVGFSLLMFLSHGLDKMVNYSERAASFPSYFTLGSAATFAIAWFAEFICPFFITIGFKTRLFCVPIIATMACAAFITHAADPLATKEMALLYLVGFSSVLLAGPGQYSIGANRG